MDNQTKQSFHEHIQELADLYYQNQVGEGNKTLKELMPELMAFVSILPSNRQQEYIDALRNAMEAMELQDYVLLADILIFDIANAFLTDE